MFASRCTVNALRTSYTTWSLALVAQLGARMPHLLITGAARCSLQANCRKPLSLRPEQVQLPTCIDHSRKKTESVRMIEWILC